MGSSPFSGYIKSVQGFATEITSSADFAGDYQCGGCNGNCSMCDGSGNCPFGLRDPEFLIYDFTEGSNFGASSWIPT